MPARTAISGVSSGAAIRVLIRKRGRGDPLLLYYIDPATGREVSRTSGTHDRGEAERAAAIWEQELHGYRGANDDGWEYFRDRFRDEHLATLAPRSVSAYSTALNHYWRVMRPALLSDVTAATVSQYQAKLLAEQRPLSSVRNYMTHLRAALRWAKSVGIIDKAPAVKLPRVPNRVFMRGRPVMLSEFKLMLRNCRDRKLRRLLRLLWLSGLRLGEALILSWDSPPVLVSMDAQPYPQILYYAEGHKSRRDESVPMTPELFAWLSRTKHRAGLVAPLDTKNQQLVSETISDVSRRAGLSASPGKPIGAHDLRRGFATRMARRVMPTTLQLLMRHADISTTLRYYVGSGAVDAGRELWEDSKTKPGR